MAFSKVASSQYPPRGSGLSRVGQQGSVRPEVSIDFDRQTQPAADASQFGQANMSEFRATEAEVAKAERQVRVVRVDLGQKPGCAAVRAECFRQHRRIAWIPPPRRRLNAGFVTMRCAWWLW